MSSPCKDFRREVDAVYPEHLSRLNRFVDQPSSIYKRAIKKKLSRSGRFRTTPITIDEIKEVDEGVEKDSSDSEDCASKSDDELHRQFEQFVKRRKRCVFRKGEQLIENHIRNDIIEVAEPECGVEDKAEPLAVKNLKKEQMESSISSRKRISSS